jgi:hypothetical protein
MWVAAGQAVEVGLPLCYELVEARITPPHPQKTNRELQNLVLVLLGFSLVLVSSIFSVLAFLPFGMGIFTLCHYILKVSNLFFHFYAAKSLP